MQPRKCLRLSRRRLRKNFLTCGHGMRLFWWPWGGEALFEAVKRSRGESCGRRRPGPPGLALRVRRELGNSTEAGVNHMLGNLMRKLFGGRSERDAGTDEEWKEWNERRMAAKEAGEPFDESSPVPGRGRGRGRRRGRPTGAEVAAGAFLVGPPVDHHFGGHDAGGFGGGAGAGGF